MSTIIKLCDVSMRFDEHLLYDSVNIRISSGEKVLVCGENGCGKTTLLNIISRNITPDDGDVYIDPSVQIAKLPAYEEIDGSVTVHQYIDNLFRDINALEKKLRCIEMELSSTDSDEILNEYNDVFCRFESLGGYKYLQSKEEFIQTFELTPFLDTVVNLMSGGEKQYLRLASVLFGSAALLLLDEPFVFLDHRKTSWLVNYLKAINKTIIVASHDYSLVHTMATSIIFISDWKVKQYHTSFDGFERTKSEETGRSNQLNTTLEKYIASREASLSQQKEWMHTAEDKHKHAVIIHRLEHDISKARIKMSPRKSSLPYNISKMTSSDSITKPFKLIQLIKVTEIVGSRCLLNNITISINDQEHYILMGENGAGKTTLLNLIMKTFPPSYGEILYTKPIRFSYVPQQSFQFINRITAYEYICKFENSTKTDLISRYSDYFESHIWDRYLCDLSMGERNRLYIFCALLKPFDVLILDEPTSFSDSIAKSQIVSMINNVAKCVIVATHDSEVIDNVNGIRMLLSNGELK